MGTAGLASTGFTPPLPAGSYSFWVREASVGTVNYGFDFTISTPEPGSWTMILAGLALFVGEAARGHRVAAAKPRATQPPWVQ